ncbi:DUF805 domain-containing protein [Neolewinella persica]|uniref:DUF805 domain-containing protein n=1 Tax=Neolewinella persica TaxID=70998 RepID=UPI0003625A1F|nr:DUF805 domain-containing protein [Neolewinella persica]
MIWKNFILALNNYLKFEGRSRRAEFWSFVLVTMLFGAAASFWDNLIFNEREFFEGLVNLAFLVPSIAVSTRRLHDIGRSGWWQLLWLTGIGGLVLIYWYAQDSDSNRNEYGSSPKYDFVDNDNDTLYNDNEIV